MKNTMKIYENGKLVEIVKRPVVADYSPRKVVKPVRSRLLRNRRGTNQYQVKRRGEGEWKKTLAIGFILILLIAGIGRAGKLYFNPEIISPLPEAYAKELEAGTSAILVSPTPTAKPTATPTPEKDSELVEVVAYIAKVFEPEGKEIVVQAINCFYSESGLRPNAVGQNSDGPRSKDHGVAQLNDYWHKLTHAEKTEIKANIDKAYKIYKGRGDNFSAWYGKRCN